MWKLPLPVPAEPVRTVLIGAGRRTQGVYLPLLCNNSLTPWIKIVAVCDPVMENCAQVAAAIGVPAYADIRQVARDKIAEAAIVVTPVESHHSISLFLSSHGIHNLTETTWASTIRQAREMIQSARDHRVIVRVGENFFRFPIDRFAQTVRDSGYLGRIGRIVSYADHTGYHNNSRWIVFAGCHPDWVQCVEHGMTHPPFYSTPERYHEQEKLQANFFHFPNDFLVADIGTGYEKGYMGRIPRPGYTEWHGELGALVYAAGHSHEWYHCRTELRKIPPERLAEHQRQTKDLNWGGVASAVSPVIEEVKDDWWRGIYADTPEGRIEYRNPFVPAAGVGIIVGRNWYGTPIMDQIVDFALAVRGLRASEFTGEDALMSAMMLMGSRESVLNQGKRIGLPLTGELEADALELQRQREAFGVDPLDMEAMLAISYPRP